MPRKRRSPAPTPTPSWQDELTQLLAVLPQRFRPRVLRVLRLIVQEAEAAYQAHRLAAQARWRELVERILDMASAYCKRRNRQTSPTTIEREAQIARLKAEHPTWTWRKIGNHADPPVKDRSARRMYRRHLLRQYPGPN